MGYYDDHYNEPKKKSGGRPFLAALSGAVIGSVITLTALPVLQQFNVISLGATEQQTTNNVPSPSKQVKFDKTTAVNVDTQVTKVVSEVSAAVVRVINIQRQTDFFGTETSSGEAGAGSGVIYKKANGKAFIVTNHHVVQGASSLEVSLSNGTKAKAKLLGSDQLTDLAVLEIDDANVTTVAQFGNSDAVKVGEPVIAIGNPVSETFSGSVTQGIISGTNRSVPVDLDSDGNPDWQADVLQTDAAINPGNSGGALVNIDGQLIGINSMKIAQESVEGIGLSIPVNTARHIIEDLEKFGEVRRPYMGVSLRSLEDIPEYHLQETLHLPTNVTKGVAILNAVANSPATRAGLETYDVIVELDGKKIDTVIDLRRHLYNDKSVGDKMEVKFYRDGKLKKVTMTLAKESF